jgi:hypothetical protein
MTATMLMPSPAYSRKEWVLKTIILIPSFMYGARIALPFVSLSG